MELMKIDNDKITSLDILREINIFRKEEGKAILRHDTLRDIIKDELEDEILSQKILEKSIESNGGRPLKVYILTLNQAKQILIRESKFVRRAVIKYIENLESELKLSYSREKKLLEERYQMKLIENDNLNEMIEKLQYDNGNGKNYKSINNIKWWDEYFYINKKGFIRKLTEELIRLSGELGINYDSICPTYSEEEILVFHIKTYANFKERLKNDIEISIMTSYRKMF